MNTPYSTVILAAAALKPLGDAEIDPRIIVHPPQSRIGDQPSGTQIAQNLYPGLTFQRIDGPLGGEQPRASKPDRLSTTWRNLEVKRIPTQWPKFKMEPVAGAGEASSFAIPSPQK
jgi:hypothetical protein